MPLIARFVLAPLLLGVWISLELQFRRRRFVKPSSWKELLVYIDKKKAPRAQWIPVLFVFIAVVLFSAWEFLLWHMFGAPNDHWSWVVGLLLWAFALYCRKLAFDRAELSLKRFDLLLLALSFVVFFKSILGGVLLLWLFLRASFLNTKKG